MSTESSANHCLASFCCTTQATCRQAEEGKKNKWWTQNEQSLFKVINWVLLWWKQESKNNSHLGQSWREGRADTDPSCKCRSLSAWEKQMGHWARRLKTIESIKPVFLQTNTRPEAAACPPVPCPAHTAREVYRGGTQSGSSPKTRVRAESKWPWWSSTCTKSDFLEKFLLTINSRR